MHEIQLHVNGFTREVLVQPHETLLHTLRERLFLTGTKCGCDEATCGACTVLLDGKPVLSCITPSMRCQGKRIVTIEGLGQNGELHPVQEKLVEKGGIQCGYCTPGIVMTAVPFLQEQRNPDETAVREALSGNLCRCTGYKKIVEAVLAAAAALRPAEEDRQ